VDIPKNPLDTESYKRYYVNYKVCLFRLRFAIGAKVKRATSSRVPRLCAGHSPPFSFWWYCCQSEEATRPASLILEFPKEQGIWKAMLEDIQDAKAHDFGERVFGVLPVKSFSFEDHQFIQVHMKRKNGGESVTWIPRDIVTGIVEGKTEKSAAFYFGGGKK
jgi:hypothetical protein